MHVKSDMAFIAGLTSLFDYQSSDEKERQRFSQELESLKTLQVPASSEGTPNYFDLLHLSPLKIHLSFSLRFDSGWLNSLNDLVCTLISFALNSLSFLYRPKFYILSFHVLPSFPPISVTITTPKQKVYLVETLFSKDLALWQIFRCVFWVVLSKEFITSSPLFRACLIRNFWFCRLSLV